MSLVRPARRRSQGLKGCKSMCLGSAERMGGELTVDCRQHSANESRLRMKKKSSDKKSARRGGKGGGGDY